MSQRTFASIGRCLVVLLALVGFGSGLRAQERPAAVPPATAPVAFAAGGISLTEAFQLTFQNDPKLMLSQANVDYAAGVAQQQGGLFDFTVGGNMGGEYRQQELRESRKEIEQTKRDDLQDAINSGEAYRPAAEQLLKELNAALAAPPGTEQISDPVIQAQMVLIRSMLPQIGDQRGRDELISLRRQILVDNATSVSTKLNKALSDLADAKVQRERLGATPFDEFFKRANVTLNVGKRFRNGIYVSPFVDGSLNGTNFMGKEIDAKFGGKGVQDLYTFRSGLDLTLPLMRGRGSATAAAGERAAKAEHQAAQLTNKHQSSASAVKTVHAYWDLRAAQESLDVAQRSLGLQDRLLEATQRLINGGEMPSADLSRVQASNTRARARLEDARRRLHEARVNLALAMGVTVNDDPATLPVAKDPFPAPQLAALPSDAELKALVNNAPGQRQDLKASAAHTESGALLAKGARLDTRARLDLTGRTWLTGLGEINASNALDRWVGPSFSASLGLEIPLGNNFYRGRSLQRQADLRQRQISQAELARQIKLNVVRNGGTLREAATRVQQAQDAVGFSRKTIEAEMEKFQAGDSTLVDTIITEEQQTDALLNLVSAQADYAHLVAQLRYETGVLAPDAVAVTPDSLVAVPRGARQ